MVAPFSQVISLQLEPTGYCELRCEHCCVDRSHPAGFLSTDLARRIAGQCLPGQEIRLSMGGEPLWHPYLDRIVAIAREHVARVTVCTSATRLTAATAERLIAAGLTHLVIGFDGVDRDEYERVRVGARFDEVSRNIEAWLRLNRGRVRTTLRRVIRAGQEPVGLDGVFPGADEYTVAVRENWDVERKVDGTGAPPVTVPCPLIHYRMAVLWDGRAVLCTADVNGRAVIGDARVQTLEEIWNGAALQEVRRRQDRHEPVPEMCSRCERYPY